MGHDPNEKPMSKAAAAPSRAGAKGVSDTLDKYRWQGPVQGQDEIHVHDDKNNTCFVWKGSRSFRIAWQQLLQEFAFLDDGEILGVIGETSLGEGSTRKAGVLVFENVKGIFELTVEAYDAQEVYDKEVRKQPVLQEIDEWVERRC